MPRRQPPRATVRYGTAPTGGQDLLGAVLRRFDIVTIDDGEGELRLDPRG